MARGQIRWLRLFGILGIGEGLLMAFTPNAYSFAPFGIPLPYFGFLIIAMGFYLLMSEE